MLPVVDSTTGMPRPRRNFARWRALTLSLVYIVFAIHIIHWKMTGKTLAPLELNEVMYTLELGIITAGFLFMCFLVLGTLFFGRFFCSWACHIMVLQDLCAWILRKLGIRQKPIRSRLLLLVPPLTAFYMFIWPQIIRAWESRAFPTFHMRTDAEGWASFVTDNFWRNLPSAPVIALTFLVCGFAIVYLLGSRTFCTYVCPYGAIFALADRFSPARILVSDACKQCGTCTAACTSGVRVHEEVKRHGMIVNPACLKDLDCVSACPQGALHYGRGRPSLWASHKSGGRFGSLSYDFSLAEELLVAAVFITVLLTFRGLYSRVPFLLSLALGGIIGYLAVVTVRMWRQANVKLATIPLKRLGRMTGGGGAYLGFVALLAVFVGHSAFVRYHEYSGLRQARAFAASPDLDDVTALGTTARAHLATADRWGLIDNIRVKRQMLAVSFRLKRYEDAEKTARALLARHPNDLEARLRLAQSLMGREHKQPAEQEFRRVVAPWRGYEDQAPPTVAVAYQALGELAAQRGDYESADDALRRALAIDPTRAGVHAQLGSVLAELGRFEDAVQALREAVRLEPSLGRAQYNLGTILAHLGRLDEAVPCYEKALANGTEDADVHNNLGLALMRMGRLDASEDHLRRAIALDAESADAHFNLGVLYSKRHQANQASAQFQIAVRLDPRYARYLE